MSAETAGKKTPDMSKHDHPHLEGLERLSPSQGVISFLFREATLHADGYTPPRVTLTAYHYSLLILFTPLCLSLCLSPLALLNSI